MKILCVADQIDPLVYSESVRERFGDVEMVISAGDLPMSFLGFLASSLNKPVAFVFGNHNLKELDRFEGRPSPAEQLRNAYGIPSQSYGATYIDGKVRRIKGLLIGGLGGSIRYNEGAHQFSDRQMRRRIFRMIPRLLVNRIFFGRFLDIFVTHAPPRYIHDRDDLPHHGFECFRWFLETFKPRYHLHGHIHLYDLNAPRITSLGQTTIINAFSYFVLDTEDDR